MTQLDDVHHVLVGRLRTSRYQSWRPADGIPIRSTVGAPKFWTGPPLLHAKSITPYGLLGPELSDDEAEARYVARLDRDEAKVLAELAGIAGRHEGKSLVICCYERVGQPCHRHWFSRWMEDRFGIEVPEVVVDGPPRLF